MFYADDRHRVSPLVIIKFTLTDLLISHTYKVLIIFDCDHELENGVQRHDNTLVTLSDWLAERLIDRQ